MIGKERVFQVTRIRGTPGQPANQRGPTPFLEVPYVYPAKLRPPTTEYTHTSSSAIPGWRVGGGQGINDSIPRLLLFCISMG